MHVSTVSDSMLCYKPMLKSMGEAKICTPARPEPLDQSLCPPRELMCKIWFESIQPLRLCACVFLS